MCVFVKFNAVSYAQSFLRTVFQRWVFFNILSFDVKLLTFGLFGRWIFSTFRLSTLSSVFRGSVVRHSAFRRSVSELYLQFEKTLNKAHENQGLALGNLLNFSLRYFIIRIISYFLMRSCCFADFTLKG
jgi:hypothetical protein